MSLQILTENNLYKLPFSALEFVEEQLINNFKNNLEKDNLDFIQYYGEQILSPYDVPVDLSTPRSIKQFCFSLDLFFNKNGKYKFSDSSIIANSLLHMHSHSFNHSLFCHIYYSSNFIDNGILYLTEKQINDFASFLLLFLNDNLKNLEISEAINTLYSIRDNEKSVIIYENKLSLEEHNFLSVQDVFSNPELLQKLSEYILEDPVFDWDDIPSIINENILEYSSIFNKVKEMSKPISEENFSDYYFHNNLNLYTIISYLLEGNYESI